MEATLCNTIAAFLAFSSSPSPPGTQPNPTGQMVYTMGMLLFMGFIFYFLIIRPQRVRAGSRKTC
jgi:hypothetical protein